MSVFVLHKLVYGHVVMTLSMSEKKFNLKESVHCFEFTCIILNVGTEC